jgi:hypothetical protein
MGDIADMFLDGTCCQYCGEILDCEGSGYPVSCAGCSEPQENKKNINRFKKSLKTINKALKNSQL